MRSGRSSGSSCPARRSCSPRCWCWSRSRSPGASRDRAAHDGGVRVKFEREVHDRRSASSRGPRVEDCMGCLRCRVRDRVQPRRLADRHCVAAGSGLARLDRSARHRRIPDSRVAAAAAAVPIACERRRDRLDRAARRRSAMPDSRWDSRSLRGPRVTYWSARPCCTLRFHLHDHRGRHRSVEGLDRQFGVRECVSSTRGRCRARAATRAAGAAQAQPPLVIEPSPREQSTVPSPLRPTGPSIVQASRRNRLTALSGRFEQSVRSRSRCRRDRSR